MIDLPADQAARDRALSPQESFHLEAPAGSGKTSVLLARFLTLLAKIAAPEELLALTFTRKAAGELRSVNGQIEFLLRQAVQDRRKSRPGAGPRDEPGRDA